MQESFAVYEDTSCDRVMLQVQRVCGAASLVCASDALNILYVITFLSTGIFHGSPCAPG
jgi:hypothetical protein